MTSPLDGIGNPFLQDVTNPFAEPDGFVKRDPLTAGSMDEATNIMRDNALHGIASLPRPVLNVLGVAGKTVQPFAAPQQLIFSGIKAIEDASTGGFDQAWADLKRGGSSALSYLTYQHGRDLPGILKNKAAPDTGFNPITGYELFKQTGAPSWVARWAGTASDFLLDVPLLGTVGKVAKVDRLTAGLRIGENMASAFDSPAALRAFAGGVAAAPFTTQPIKRLVEAIPQGYRQAGREAIIDPLLNARIVPKGISDPISPTVGQAILNRGMGVDAPVTAAVDRKNAVLSQYAVLHNEALGAFDKARKGLRPTDQKTLDALVGKLADTSDLSARARLEGQIRALEAGTGRVGLYDDAIKAVNKGIQFDTFSAEKLHAAGLMDPAELAKYQAGDKRHLRRVFAFYGEDPGSHVRRLMDRDAPAQLVFDTPALEQLYTNSLARGVPMTTAAPSAPDFARAVQAAYTNPAVHPATALRDFFTANSMSTQHIDDILTDIGHDWAKKAGIDWRPSDEQTVRYLTSELASQGTGGAGMAGRGTKAVTTARTEVSPMYADVLGEIENFTDRINKQVQVAGRAATTNGVIRDIRQHLTDNNLIEKIDTADMGAIHKTAGLRVINADQARALGNGFTEGEIIPAEIHRILVEQTAARADAPLGLAWQWYSSRWQGIKLANPASIATNIKSAFVMADQAGHSIPALMVGIKDYLVLHRAAVRGDGAMDTAARVNGVSMKELFDHGAFTHNTLMNAEVVQQSNRLINELANAGSSNPLQRGVAAMQQWLTETTPGQGVAGAYRTAVTPMRWLGDTYGRTDSIFKGGLYMSLRKQGVTAEKAATIADETFFNYNNVPYVVDGLRKLGLAGMPFASFKFLAAGRFFKAMYTNPYGVQKYYRLPNSSRAAMNDEQTADGQNALSAYDAGSPDYVRRGLYIPLGKDSQGRARAVKMDDILPESAVFDSFNADGVAGTVPPAVQLAAQIISGKGYQGIPLYRTGDTWANTMDVSPQEAARGAVKALWQFGAYPWAPGQPMTERIVKALAAKSVPVETLHPVAREALKVLTEGPAAAVDPKGFSVERKGSAAPQDRIDALARVLGVKSYPVTTSASVPGSFRNNLTGLDARIKLLDTMESDEMKSATDDATKQEIRDRYDARRRQLLGR